MPIVLRTQQDLRTVRKLPFCYLCGKPLDGSQDVNDDHIPPTTVFLRADRDVPLILPTHEACNHRQSKDDQAVGQLVGLLHGSPPDMQHIKLTFYAGQTLDGAPLAAVTGVDLRHVIRRWLRGFHAALYAEPLSADSVFATNPPLPEVEITSDAALGHLALDKIDVQAVMPKLAALVAKRRTQAHVDTVLSRNGKCRYDCVWTFAEDGRRFCAYELKVYDWVTLGDTTHFEPRTCVGMYARPDFGAPAIAALVGD